MEPSKVPTPEETEAFFSGFGTVSRYALGIALTWTPFIVMWLWRASKEHLKLQQLDQRVTKIEEDYAPISVVDGKLAACRDKQDKEHGDKLHDIVMEFKEDQEYTNKMLYLLLGERGLRPPEPPPKRGAKRPRVPPMYEGEVQNGSQD